MGFTPRSQTRAALISFRPAAWWAELTDLEVSSGGEASTAQLEHGLHPWKVLISCDGGRAALAVHGGLSDLESGTFPSNPAGNLHSDLAVGTPH